MLVTESTFLVSLHVLQERIHLYVIAQWKMSCKWGNQSSPGDTISC